MTRRIITVVAVAAMLMGAAAPLSESVALAAQKKRTCSCKPTLHRRHRSRAKTQVASQAALASQNGDANAAMVGPVFATYTLPRNQYFRLRMNQTINSGTARVGDRFQATVVTPVYASGIEVVPAGSHARTRGPARSAVRFGGDARGYQASARRLAHRTPGHSRGQGRF